jgi:mono/diheme cytochrome c family protein
MSGVVRRRWKELAILPVLAVAGVVAMVGFSVPDPAMSPSLAARQPDREHGAYLALVGDCAACHTAAAGKPFAGGLPLPSPLGTIHSTNITPDAATGIGRWSLKDFARAMRLGVAPDGRRLYPAMPYTAFAKVSDEDLADLFAYLQSGVVAVSAAPPANGIVWPLSIRWPLAFWNLAFHDDSRFVPDPSRDEQWNRGAYLVQGLAHCGTCHTPRGPAFQEKDVSGNGALYLSGARLNDASAINLRGNTGDGLGRWSSSDLSLLLKSGRMAHSAVTGAMSEVVQHSTQFMSDPDIAAMAAYLKSLSPAPQAGRAAYSADEQTLQTIMAGQERSTGGRIYMDSCAACHRLSGQGEDFVFPALAGNPSVLNADPASFIAVILKGARLPSTDRAPTGLAMPGFGWRYGDQDLAALATFVRTGWGNRASPVTAQQVAKVRQSLSR